MPEYDFLEYHLKERIAYITLNRPEKRNALNDRLVQELKHAIGYAEQSAEVKVIVINAYGPAFCAGADLDYLRRLQGYTIQENLEDSQSLAELFLIIYRCTKVVIAQVEGHAIAGGAGLMTVCDFTFVTPESRIGYTEVRIGFVPAIVMVFLLRKIGETRAKELLLSGNLITPEEAYAYHLINRVVPAKEIREFVYDFATQMCEKNSAASLQLTKKMIADVQSFPLENAVGFASKMNAHARNTPDCRRGIAAFLNKEQISW